MSATTITFPVPTPATIRASAWMRRAAARARQAVEAADAYAAIEAGTCIAAMAAATAFWFAV